MKYQKWKTNIAKFLTAQTISLFGSSLVQYAIIWHITISTSSGKMITISTLCGFLPQIFIALFGGIWIDRYDRKKMIMLADSIIAISTLILALAFMSGYQNIWLLFAVLTIRSAGSGIQTPSVNSMIPEIVPNEHLMRINGINSTLSSIIMFLSPAISGVILSIAPLEITLFIDVITAIIGVALTATVSVTTNKKGKFVGDSGFSQLKAGFLYLKSNSFIKNLLVFQLLILFLISPSAFLNPLMVSRTFGAEVWRLTVTEMTYSLGMIFGGLLIASWGGFKKKLDTTLLAGALYGSFMFGLGVAPIFLIYLACNIMIGVTSPCYNSPIIVSIQENVDQNMQGRVFSFMQIATSCAFPFGMMVFGPLADIVPVESILMISGILVLLAVIFAWKTKALDIK